MRISDLAVRDALTTLIATCERPRADRSCALLDAIENQPSQRRSRSQR